MTTENVPARDAGGLRRPGLAASGGYAGRPSLAVDRDSPTPPTSRHLAWCKQMSDLNKHPDTQGHPAAELGMMLMMSGHLSTARDMREFIEGVN